MNSNTPGSKEIFEAFQRMINPMAFPMQNLLMGGMKLEDIERKISELTTVHHWLSTNLGMLELSIKTLEYQKALLTPAKKDGKREAEASAPENPFLNPKNWPWPYGQPSAEEKAEDAKKPESRLRAAARKRSD
jgi:hypothetical protein